MGAVAGNIHPQAENDDAKTSTSLGFFSLAERTIIGKESCPSITQVLPFALLPLISKSPSMNRPNPA